MSRRQAERSAPSDATPTPWLEFVLISALIFALIGAGQWYCLCRRCVNQAVLVVSSIKPVSQRTAQRHNRDNGSYDIRFPRLPATYTIELVSLECMRQLGQDRLLATTGFTGDLQHVMAPSPGAARPLPADYTAAGLHPPAVAQEAASPVAIIIADAHPDSDNESSPDESPVPSAASNPAPTPSHSHHAASPPPNPAPPTPPHHAHPTYTPGVGDGGRLKRCFQRWAIQGVDWTRPSTPFDQLAADIIDVLLWRAKHKATQAAAVDLVRLMYKHNTTVAPNERPTEYRQFLTFLEDRGLISGDTFVEYNYCLKCGCLYRGAMHASTTCLNPDCGASRCEDATGTFLYRCARDVVDCNRTPFATRPMTCSRLLNFIFAVTPGGFRIT